jgi:MraZ protein
MPGSQQLILGEFPRRLDDRYRLSIPNELAELAVPESGDAILAKERPGCLSLWNAAEWQAKFDARVELIQQRMRLGDLDRDISQVQLFGRLLSTRQKQVKLAGRGRLVIPEGFREFLAVEPEGEVMVVGAGVCIEIWHPEAWLKYLRSRMPKFRRLFERLSR